MYITALGVFLVVALFSASRSSASCLEGCEANFEPTLATNKLTYLNGCIAHCQGASIISGSSSQKAAGARPATAADMYAHAAEGFHFLDFARVRRIQTSSQGSDSAVGVPPLEDIPSDRVVLYDVARGAIYATTTPALLPATPAGAAVSAAAAAKQPSLHFHRAHLTKTPELQQGLGAAAAAPTADVSITTVVPAVQSSRKLMMSKPAVAGIAAAAAVAEGSFTAAVGQLLSRGQKSHCTASFIGERTILTAAHCVYDRSRGTFSSGLYFVPGRYRDATTGEIHAPYGAYEISEVFISSRFVGADDSNILSADIAVIRLQTHVQIGRVTGYLGVSVAEADSSSTVQDIRPTEAAATAAAGALSKTGSSRTLVYLQQQLTLGSTLSATTTTGSTTATTGTTGGTAAARLHSTVATAGYPSNHPEGTLRTSKCQVEQQAIGGNAALLSLSGCSVHAGQEGSPLVTESHQVCGVVSCTAAAPASSNQGTAITQYIYNTLIEAYAV